MSNLLFVIIIVILAWTYDFLNGANDRANAVAATVSSRSLTFFQANLLAAVLNMAGAFITTRVAKTIGKGIIDPSLMSKELLIAALVGTIVWVWFCTHYGLPVSITHSLVGGMIGAGIIAVGVYSLNYTKLILVGLAMVVSPLVAFIGGAIMIGIMARIFFKVRPRPAATILKKGQIFSTGFLSLSHGANDAQNAMGMITASLLVAGYINDFIVPYWVMAGSGLFMGLGTFFIGQRVIKTMGVKLVKIDPLHAFSADTASSLIIFLNTFMGLPISTTHISTVSIMGSGIFKRLSAVRWGVAGNILAAWVLTVPGAALLSGFSYWLIKLFL